MKLKSTRILRVEQCNNNQEEAHESCPLGSSLTLGRSKSLTTYNRNVSSHVPPLCIPQRPDTPSKSQEFTNSPRLLHHRSRPSPSQSFLSRSASSNQNPFALQRQHSGREGRFKKSPTTLPHQHIKQSPSRVPHPPEEQRRHYQPFDSPLLFPMDELNLEENRVEKYEFPLWKKAPKNPMTGDALVLGRKVGLHIDTRSSGCWTPLSSSCSPIMKLPPSVHHSSSPLTNDDAQNWTHVKPVGFSWKCGELIGEGTFGKVYRGLNNVTGEFIAVKQIETIVEAQDDQESVAKWMMMQNSRQSSETTSNNSLSHFNKARCKYSKLEEEITLMKDLDHPHIVRYIGTDRTPRFFYILMEYVPGGTIASMLSQFGILNEDLIRLYIRQICQGVAYLHSKGIIHRDIKGVNVLVNEQGMVKLADFGCSKQLETVRTMSLDESLRSIRGSVPWMAPEVVKQTGHDYKADIWSIGALVIEMSSAKHPWPAFTNNLSVMYSIATTTTSPPIPDHVSPGCQSFLSRCFCIDPHERATATELLAHSFLNS